MKKLYKTLIISIIFTILSIFYLHFHYNFGFLNIDVLRINMSAEWGGGFPASYYSFTDGILRPRVMGFNLIFWFFYFLTLDGLSFVFRKLITVVNRNINIRSSIISIESKFFLFLSLSNLGILVLVRTAADNSNLAQTTHSTGIFSPEFSTLIFFCVFFIGTLFYLLSKEGKLNERKKALHKIIT